MKTSCNFCKEHQLPLIYICMKQDCPCIPKIYCEKCQKIHFQKHNSKCISKDQICKKIKGCIKPYQILRDNDQVIKKVCILEMKQQKAKQINTIKTIRGQFRRYKEAIKQKLTKFEQSIYSQQKRLNQFHKASNVNFLNLLLMNQVLSMRINLSNAQGLLYLHKMEVACKEAIKQYSQFLDQTKDYANSKKTSLGLQDLDNIIIKGVYQTIEQAYKDQNLLKPQTTRDKQQNKKEKIHMQFIFDSPRKQARPVSPNKQNDH